MSDSDGAWEAKTLKFRTGVWRGFTAWEPGKRKNKGVETSAIGPIHCPQITDPINHFVSSGRREITGCKGSGVSILGALSEASSFQKLKRHEGLP